MSASFLKRLANQSPLPFKSANLAIMFAVAFLLSGCGTTHYLNSNPARNNQVSFNQDSSYCQAVAVGSAPMPNAPQYQNNVPMYVPGSGTMRDQYGNTYRYQENYNPFAAAQSNMAMAQQGWANAAAGFQHAGAQFEALAAREAIFNNCMLQNGWRQASKQEFEAVKTASRVQSIQLAAEQGNAEAQFFLAGMYFEGQGIGKDERKAREWCQKAAAQGYAPAQINLGRMYADGYGGLAKDERKALEWFRKAAEQGHPIAQDIVGDAYRDGFGVAKDIKRANEWWGKAMPGLRTLAEQGSPEAQSRLAGGLYCGLGGVAKDEAQAMKWLKKAAAAGYQSAQDVLKKIKQDGRLDWCPNS